MGLHIPVVDRFGDTVGAAAVLRAGIKTVGTWPFTYETLPASVRERAERHLALGSPQEAMRELQTYARTLMNTERRQDAAERFRKARRAHGVPKQLPRWQRGARRPRSIESAMSDPRIRGQLAGV